MQFSQEMTHHDATVFHSSELTERRVRLAIGLKRYFHSKRMEGLLSTGVRLSNPGPPVHRVTWTVTYLK